MPVRKILKATVLSRTNLSHAPVKLRTLTPPTPVQKLVIYFSFFLSPFVFLLFESFCIFNLHLSVSFRIYFGIFYFTRVPPTDPETSSGWHLFFFATSSVRVIPNLVRNLFPFTLGPFHRSWNKFRMTVIFLRPPQSVSFRIYFGIFFLLLSLPPTDPETSSGWRVVRTFLW